MQNYCEVWLDLKNKILLVNILSFINIGQKNFMQNITPLSDQQRLTERILKFHTSIPKDELSFLESKHLQQILSEEQTLNDLSSSWLGKLLNKIFSLLCSFQTPLDNLTWIIGEDKFLKDYNEIMKYRNEPLALPSTAPAIGLEKLE